MRYIKKLHRDNDRTPQIMKMKTGKAYPKISW